MAATLTDRRAAGTRRPPDERGAELVEFALALPLMLVLVTGIFDFGLAFQQFEVLTNAAREGARLGSMPGYGVSDVQSRVNGYCVAGGLPGGCPADTVSVDRSAIIDVGGQTVSAVQVTVNYGHTFALVGPVLRLINGSLGSVTLRATSTMRCEVGCS
jgi:Flp pilus assembly protein TadG